MIGNMSMDETYFPMVNITSTIQDEGVLCTGPYVITCDFVMSTEGSFNSPFTHQTTLLDEDFESDVFDSFFLNNMSG